MFSFPEEAFFLRLLFGLLVAGGDVTLDAFLFDFLVEELLPGVLPFDWALYSVLK